ncbi:hypothetical protein [Streptomyces sp. NPDC092307]|uniref:hypothetical protein n=1 Tax=Streptomyces sp. NPDC092307 TaxID=3366013 RepID=UPI00380F4E67
MVIGLLLILFVGGILTTAATSGERQLIPAVSCGAATLVGYLMVAMVMANVDLQDPAAASLPLTHFVIGAGLGLGATVLGWFAAGPASGE